MQVNALLRLRTLVNRHRRILGSISAALAVLLIFGSMSAPAPATGPDRIVAGLPEGFVAVPVTLRSAAIASAVRVGDKIDLVVPSETGTPQVIALNAAVLDLPDASGFGSPTSTVILVSVQAWQGAALAAEDSDQISLVINSR
jgi:hypothetical protein